MVGLGGLTPPLDFRAGRGYWRSGFHELSGIFSIACRRLPLESMCRSVQRSGERER